MFCSNCGKEQLVENPTFCYNCGAKLIQEPVTQAGVMAAVPVAAVPVVEAKPLVYAGFWRRFAAYFIDFILVSIVTAIAGAIIDNAIYYSLGGEDSSIEQATIDNIAAVVASLVSLIIVWLYYALMESSVKQATLGKMALGIVAIDYNGKRISFGRATGRYFAKFISWIILLIGLIMIAFTEKKQGLHDMIAGTLVVKK